MSTKGDEEGGPVRPGVPPRRSATGDSGARGGRDRARPGAHPPTASPPPVRPAALDGPPPPLRPRSADATIPLAPPEPRPAQRTPVPDVARSGDTPVKRVVRQPDPDTPPLPRPPGVDPAADAPRLDTDASAPTRRERPTPDDPTDEVLHGLDAVRVDEGPQLASDDEILDDLDESVSPDVDLFGVDEDQGPTPTAAPTRAPLWRRWLTPPPPPEPGRTTSRLSRHLAYEVVVVAVTAVIATILIFTSFDGEIRDAYIKGRELLGGYPAPTSGQVTLVTIGEEALYLWDPTSGPPEVTPRAMLGELVHVLDQAGADVIVLDFLLDAPAPGDDRLAQAVSAHGRVVAAERFVVTDPATGGRFAAGPAVGLGPDLATGYANLGEEALWTSAEERLVRSARLVDVVNRARLDAPWPASVGQAQGEGEVTPHMALLTAWLHAHPGASPDTLLAELAARCEPATPTCEVGLSDLGLPPGPALAGRTSINFRGPEHGDGLPTLRASELLRLAGEPALYRLAGVDKPLEIPDWLRERVQGKVVILGRVDEAAGDRFATPFGFPLPVGADMDGARVQAQAIDTLISGRHVRRVPAWTGWALAAALLAGLVATARFFREDVHTLLGLATGAALVGGGTLLFIVTDGLVLDVTTPLTALLLGLVAIRLRGWAVD